MISWSHGGIAAILSGALYFAGAAAQGSRRGLTELPGELVVPYPPGDAMGSGLEVPPGDSYHIAATRLDD